MLGSLSSATRRMARSVGWERILLLGLLVIASFLLFHNLKYNPRPWHDEGAALSVSRTLVEDGIYAVKTSDGYQTFGPIQSVGPTVLLPVALSFKLFGVGLVQGRIVAAGFAFLTLAILYRCGFELFGRRAALIALFLVIASPSVGFLLFGRQVLGEVPALGFFLAGWLTWARALRTRRAWLYPIAGMLLGAAMITKTQYTIMVAGTLFLLAVLDLLYYRQGNLKGLVAVGLVALACLAAWWAWQVVYFGMDTFQENAAKLRELAGSTTGFHLYTTIQALQGLFGSSGPIYYFWIVPGLLYAGRLCLRKNQSSFSLAFLLTFAILWFAYYIFWIIPWPHYVLAPLTISGLFVAKLYYDLVRGVAGSKDDLWREIRWSGLEASSLSSQALVTLGTLVALTTMGLLVGNQLQKTIRTDVLDKVGQETTPLRSPPQLQDPHQVAAFLDEAIETNLVIETWERELDILTDHLYHHPDQSLLAQTHAAVYHNGPRNYTLGAEYLESTQASYVIIGWYSRLNGTYDGDFVEEHGSLIATIGQQDWRYDIYKLNQTPLAEIAP